jgi:thymidylate kinase
MSFIYITGPSGSGKSTVRNELIKRGYEAHDTDEDGMSAWYEETMKERVVARTTNDFGKSPDELKLMLYWHGKMIERYKEWGATMVDAHQSLDKVVNAVLEAAK